jgi:ribosomal protein L11 methyltransferase
MKWTKVSLKTTTQAVDLISALFDEIGLEGIEIEDKIPLSEEDKKAMFIDILPELGEDDGVAVINSYVDTDTDIESLRRQIEEGLEELAIFTDLGARELTFEEHDDGEWIDNWKEYFKPFYAAEHILVKPSWEELPEDKKEEDIVIEIDPGTAFGTGSHETTKLCIEGLERELKAGDRVLDVGCGSGILSIVSLKLGAEKAVGTDIDEIALTVTAENMERNHITKEQFVSYGGNLIDDEELQKKVGEHCYDVVVANILADVIIPLSGEIAKHMKKDGVFISSGIINTKKDEVEKALAGNGFEILKVCEMKDWVSFTAKIK